MTWNFGDRGHFRFSTKLEEIYFEIFFKETFPECFDEDEKQLFQCEYVNDGKEKKKHFLYSYRVKDGKVEVNGVPEPSPSHYAEDVEYTACERRVLEESSPISMSVYYLYEIYKDHTVVFYTGAGISAASGVPTMNQLFDLLQMTDGEEILYSLKNILAAPQEIVDGIKIFHDACVYNSPTNAHLALAYLAKEKRTQLLTENLDLLHERTGIIPYRINGDRIRKCIDPSGLSEIDYIICVGLSYDDRGFLGWYKKHYPEGKIIAVDLKQPSYLGNEDALIIGDLQEIIPALQNTFKLGY